jgi:hypothetical protein
MQLFAQGFAGKTCPKTCQAASFHHTMEQKGSTCCATYPWMSGILSSELWEVNEK